MDYFAVKEEFNLKFTHTTEISERMGVKVFEIGFYLKKEIFCPPREREHFILMLTLDGSAWMQEGRKRKRLFRNDWTLLNPGQAHTYKSIGDWSFLYVKFEGKFIDYIIKDFSFFKRDNLYFRQTDNNSEQIFFRLAESRKNPGHTGEIQRNALLLELLSSLHRSYAAKGVSENPLHEAQKYIMENLDGHISLEMLAKKANMSLSHFVRVFKERMGYTPINLINKLRIERAQELIRQYSGVKVSEIGRMSGFKDPFYFSRVFRKWTKMSPEDFKKYSSEN
ncbi:MAG: hypothetical protein A2017_09835 [Lentisphaerae bacterium GWF2_44_16]|nr:MAG: hypothetical protein A2017_09835 [Lentisphaerae bacterium GWF2_44_16]